MADSEGSVLVDVNLGSKEGHLEFSTYDELESWIAGEDAAFGFVRQVIQRQQDPTIAQLARRFNETFNGIRQDIQHARQPKAAAPQVTAYLRQIKSRIEEYYKWMHLGATGSMRKFVFDRAKQDTVGAAYALAYLLGASPLIPQTRSGIDGIFDAYLFSKGLLESGGEAALSANLQAFDELRTQFASLLQEDRDRLEQLASEHGALLSTLREHTDTEARAFDSVLEESKRKLEEHIEAGQKELKAIADAYDAKMAVQAPVTYWEQQCTSHRKLGILFGGVAFAWACVSVVLTYYVADKFLGAAPEQTVNVLGLDLPKVPLWHITLLVVVLTFAIWITRILVRLLLSQVHLHTDAGERVVMAKTYISLLREGQGPKDEDRQLILQTLFRPSQTGVVKDDAIPATVFEWITRGVTK